VECSSETSVDLQVVYSVITQKTQLFITTAVTQRVHFPELSLDNVKMNLKTQFLEM
jgi:hypothetical protein